MKRILITIITSLSMISYVNAAEIGMGVSMNFADVDTSGTETLRQSGKLSSTTHSTSVSVPEVFVEIIGDLGSLGVAYVPAQEMGKKTRNDSNAKGDTGAYTAKAEVDAHVAAYVDANVYNFAGQQLYVKGGVAHATIVTKEALNGGSTYTDQDVWGYTYGAGLKGAIPFVGGDNYYYKAEYTLTDYDEYVHTNDVANKIKAETEIESMKISIGYKF